MAIVNGVIVKGGKILVPPKLRERIVKAGHEGHQGLEKTKAVLRSKVWYPGMDKDVKALLRNCRPCQAAVNDKCKEPIIMSVLPRAPWDAVVTDFYGPLKSGEYLLSIMDEYSRFPIVKIVKSTSAKCTIPVYEEGFSEFGIPRKVKSDNGAPFNSREFQKFANHLGFHHQKITPLRRMA